MNKEVKELKCPYCGGTAVLEDSSIIYNGKSYGPVWVCENFPLCDSYCGCHRGTTRHLGSLANRELRAHRKRAHATLDPLWKEGLFSRKEVYTRLASMLNVPEVHVGESDMAMCDRIIAACIELKTKK